MNPIIFFQVAAENFIIPDFIIFNISIFQCKGNSMTRRCGRSIRASTAMSCATPSIRRLHTGTLWAEGPAWNGVGRYLVWSDIPNDVPSCAG